MIYIHIRTKVSYQILTGTYMLCILSKKHGFRKDQEKTKIPRVTDEG